MDIEQKKVIKFFKSYLTGKKHIESDNTKAFEYFKQCIKILDDLQVNNINPEYKNLINETEVECTKFLTLTIENTLNQPIKKNNKYDKIDNIDYNKE